MLNFNWVKILIFIFTIFILTSCASLVPSNYLTPRSIQAPIRVNGRWAQSKVIPLSVDMLNSCEGQQLLQPAMQPQPYRIGSYDNLNIIVWGHPELSTVTTSTAAPLSISTSTNNIAFSPNSPVIVQADGTIFYPYVGNLTISGLTISEAQSSIAKRLSMYVRNPQVSVQVAKYRNRNIYVLGEVEKPGVQALTDKPLSLMEAISTAGGLNLSSADPSHIYLIRGSYQCPYVFWLNATTPQSLMIAQEFPLLENDIVYVSAAELSGVNRFLNQILPSITTYVIAKGLADK